MKINIRNIEECEDMAKHEGMTTNKTYSCSGKHSDSKYYFAGAVKMLKSLAGERKAVVDIKVRAYLARYKCTIGLEAFYEMHIDHYNKLRNHLNWFYFDKDHTLVYNNLYKDQQDWRIAWRKLMYSKRKKTKVNDTTADHSYKAKQVKRKKRKRWIETDEVKYIAFSSIRYVPLNLTYHKSESDGGGVHCRSGTYVATNTTIAVPVTIRMLSHEL